MLDELLLHRYMDGRLDDRARREVDEALHADPAARRTLDALREEVRLIRGVLENQSEPSHRLSDKVIADLHLEERSRFSQVRTRRLFRRLVSVAGVAALLVLCFLFVRPRDPAATVVSAAKATLETHGEKRDAAKGAHLYENDVLTTAAGQSARLELPQGAALELHENSRLAMEKTGARPILRLDSGRVVIFDSAGSGEVLLESPEGTVSVAPHSHVDIWLARGQPAVWPQWLLPLTAAPASAPAEKTALVVTVFAGAARVVPAALRDSDGLAVLSPARLRVSGTRHVEHAVDTASSWVLESTAPRDSRARDETVTPAWARIGLLTPPGFQLLGKRWSLIETPAAAAPEAPRSVQIRKALLALDTAVAAPSSADPVSALAAAAQDLHQACETLAQDDPRKGFGFTLEGLAHFAEGRARCAVKGEGDPEAWASFDAARVSCESALAPRKIEDGTETDPENALKTAFGDGGSAPEFQSLSPLAQSALLAKFHRAVALYWMARTAAAHADPANPAAASARSAAAAFAALHEQFGHSVESVAALLGQALSEELADAENGPRKALDSLHALAAKPSSGSEGAARAELDGLRQAALLTLVRLNARPGEPGGHAAHKTLSAARDFALLYPLDLSSAAHVQMQQELNTGLEALARAALQDKRPADAAEAYSALLDALDENDRNESGDSAPTAALRHAKTHLDYAEALAASGDWVLAIREAKLLEGQLPDEFRPRLQALRGKLAERK